MSPVAFKNWNTVPTTLDLNGPTLKINTQPSSVSDATVGDTVTFGSSGFATADFPAGGATDGGTIAYQWYRGGTTDAVTDYTRTNPQDDTTSVISGAGTSVLSITNVQWAEDNNDEFYCKVTHTGNAYDGGTTATANGSPLNTNTVSLSVYSVLSIQSQPQALDASQVATTEELSAFNIVAVNSDSTLNASTTYQWYLDGSALSDQGSVGDTGVVIIGSRTPNVRIQTTEGEHSLYCVVSHTISRPTSVTSNTVTFTVENPAIRLVVEEVDYTALRGSNDYGTISSSAMAVVSNDWNINYESVRDQAPVNLSGSATADPADPNSKLIFVHAPEQDMDVVIEMQGAGGADFSGKRGGRGGWGVFRMTMERNQEYTFRIGSSGGSFAYEPRGGWVWNSWDPQQQDTVRGGRGGGSCLMYKGNKLIAALGGGGGAGDGRIGGNGGGFNMGGESGQGDAYGSSGDGGSSPTQDSPLEGTPRAVPRTGSRSGGSMSVCTSVTKDIFRDAGKTSCENYTTSGPFEDSVTSHKYDGTDQNRNSTDQYIFSNSVYPFHSNPTPTSVGGDAGCCIDGNGWSADSPFPSLRPNRYDNIITSRGLKQILTNATGPVLFPETASIKRGYRRGGNIYESNGGYGMSSGQSPGGGAGGAGVNGGSGGGHPSSVRTGGGGGGAGYLDLGEVTQMFSTVSGSSEATGNASVKIYLYNPTTGGVGESDSIPTAPVTQQPTVNSVEWSNSAAPGYKIGPYQESNQSNPVCQSNNSDIKCYIQGPSGYGTNIKNRNNISGEWSIDGHSGLTFKPSSVSADRANNVSYIKFRLKAKRAGPAPRQSEIRCNDWSGSSGQYRGKHMRYLRGASYLTQNQGKGGFDGGGRRRKIFLHPNSQGSIDKLLDQPEIYTDNPNDAFIPFRVFGEVEVVFDTGGDWRVARGTRQIAHYHSYCQTEDWEITESIIYDNNPGYLNDAWKGPVGQLSDSRGYSNPRINYIRTWVVNDDEGGSNDLSMQWSWDANYFNDADRERREGNYLEYGRFVVS